jgi:VanZ family protein
MGFIFYMSSYNGQISHEQSTKVVNIIEDAKSKLQTEIENKPANESKSDADTKTGNVLQVKKNMASVQAAKLGGLDHIVRKNAHGFLYMTLAIFVSSVIFSLNKKGKDAVIYILFICMFYSVTDEFHQSFVPGRTSMVSDVLVDFCGALIGLAIFYFSYYKIYTVKKRIKHS